MLYKEPDLMFRDILADREESNPGSFFACPAFQETAENLFIARCTVQADVALQADGFAPLNDKSQLTARFFAWWPPSRKAYRVLNFDHRLVFFCETPLLMSTVPAYMHHTDFQTKLGYIPAAYDIARWIRPLQGTYEVLPSVRELHVREDDPMYYIKFHTDQEVRLRRFEMSPEVHAAAHGCVHYKMFRPHSSLRRVYEAFEQSHMPRKVVEAIKANLLD